MKKEISNLIKNIITNILENNLYKNTILIFLSQIILEIIFRTTSGLQIFNWSLFRATISMIIISLIIGFLLSFTKKLVSKILVITFNVIICLYALIQAGFLNFLGVYISFGTSSQLGAVKEYISDYIASFKWQYLFLLLPLVFTTLYYIFIDKYLIEEKKLRKKEINIKQKNLLLKRITYGIYIIILGFIYYMSLSTSFMQDKLQVVSNEMLFKNPSMPNITVKEFGIIGYGIIDIKSTIIPKASALDDVIYFKKEEDLPVNHNEPRIIDDTLWNELNETESNNNYKTLNNYFLSKNVTPYNEYTGIFQDKNLIVIMMESVNNLIINEEYFPNIYKLYSEGWSWENAYSPRNSCSTGNNELSAVTSLYTINNRCTANAYRNNTYFNSMYNLFNEKGYYSSSYHNFNDKYYYRNQIHPNLGSTYYDARKLGISISPTYGEWPSDLELMEKSIDKYINEEKFFSFLLSVTSHHPYAYSSTYGDMYMKNFSEYNKNKTTQRYMSKMTILDQAIGYLLEQLELGGKLKETVIVLYADHYPYAISTKDLQSAFDINLNEHRNIDRTPFIIYNSEIEAQKFNEYTTFMNILPTIANLFNLDYDPRLNFGHDLFDLGYPDYAIFADGSWVDSNAYYNANTGKISYVDNNYTYEAEYILQRNTIINNKIKMSNLAIEKNYFAYLEKNLIGYKKTGS